MNIQQIYFLLLGFLLLLLGIKVLAFGKREESLVAGFVGAMFVFVAVLCFGAGFPAIHFG